MNCNAAYCESSLAKRASPAPRTAKAFPISFAGSRPLGNRINHTMSAFDPKRKSVGAVCCGAQTLSKGVVGSFRPEEWVMRQHEFITLLRGNWPFAERNGLTDCLPCTALARQKKADRCPRQVTVSITAIRAFDSSEICPTRTE